MTFRRYEAYLAGLPGGLDGHPAAQAKGSLVRAVLEGLAPADAARLPAAVRPLADDPPMESEWVPEARFAALALAVADVRGLPDGDFLAWVRASNRALFRAPAYRLLMLVVSPAAMLRHAGKRWGNWHRGSTLELLGFADDGARLRLAFPPGLYDGLLLRSYAEAFAAALEGAHAKDPVVLVEEERPGEARYLARW